MKNSEWVQDKENRVKNLEEIIPSFSLGTFVGTMDEYKIALKNGKIKDGMLIVINKLK